MQIRTGFDAPSALLTLTSAEGSLAVEPEEGLVRPVITPEISAAFLPGAYVYDLKERTAGGKVRRRRQGAITVSPQVTTAPFDLPPTPGGGQFDFTSATNSAFAALI